MATLKDGLYHIRFVPVGVQAPLVGGLYATATEVGEPILAEAQGAEGLQTWKVTRTPNGRYTITQPGFQSKMAGLGPVMMGWSLANPSPSFPGGNILFKVGYVELDLLPEGEGENTIYSAMVPSTRGYIQYFQHSSGCQFYVSEEDHTVISRAFWTSTHFNRPHPHWQFIPVPSN